MTLTEPSIEKRLPTPGIPSPAERLTLSMPAMPGLRPASRPVWMMSRPVAEPKLNDASPRPKDSSAVT